LTRIYRIGFAEINKLPTARGKHVGFAEINKLEKRLI